MQKHRGLALSAYLVGATLIIIPLVDALLSISPLRFGDYRWRFGAVGMLANALLIPNAGFLLLLATAIIYSHTTFRRILGIVALVGATVFVFTIGLFALDALQTRPAVQPAMTLSFTVATLSAFTKMILGTTLLFVVGLTGTRDSGVRDTQSPPLLVGDRAFALKPHGDG